MKIKNYLGSSETEMRKERLRDGAPSFAVQFFDSTMAMLAAAYRNGYPSVELRLNFGATVDILTDYVDEFRSELKRDDISGVFVSIGWTERGQAEFVVSADFS